MMDRYPALRIIVRHGPLGAPVLALLVAALVLWLAWPSGPVVALVAALAGGGLTYLLSKAFVEIVTILTEMLVPR